MKTFLTSIAAGSVLAALATAQTPRYNVTDLGTLGGKFSQAWTVNDSGTVSGLASLPDGTQHAVLWQRGKIRDIGTPGYGGPNSGAFGANEKGQAVVQAENSTKDPNNENFCAYGTGFKCQPFIWQDGLLTPLPLLGGNNGTVLSINNRGEVSGVAENGIRDPECTTGVTAGGTGPQIFDFDAVIWGTERGQVRKLRPLPGDTVGMALWINDNGQTAGGTGRCSNSILPPLAGTPHAVIWERDGSVHDLGNLGGTGDALAVMGNIALNINNEGQAVGVSALPGNTSAHAFLWTREKGMRDLGTLRGDTNSVALGINERGEVVGASLDTTGNSRAYIWRNGVMDDLNALSPGSPLFLLLASVINSRGEIVGFGVTKSGDVHGYLATPAPRTKSSAEPKDANVTARQITLDGTASASADGSPLTYSWSIPYGSPSASILQGNTATPSVQFSGGRSVYSFQLTVTDAAGTSSTDIATINYQGN